MSWVIGDVSASETLTDNDHLYPSHINELRTSIEASLQPIINVKDYGALGDGTTNDTTALNTALAVGGYIFFPAGTYLITTQLRYTSNSYIVGAGRGKTIIKLKNGSNPGSSIFMMVHETDGAVPASGDYVSNVTIAHMSFNGNTANNTGTVDGVTVSGCRDGILYDIEAYNCSEVGIVVSSTFASDNIDHGFNAAYFCIAHNNTTDGFQMATGLLMGCRSYDNGANGMQVVAAYSTVSKQAYAIITGCSIYSNTSHGITVAAQGGADQFPVTITGCSIHYNTGDGIAQVLEQGTISNNLITYNGEAGIRVTKNYNNISNNIIKNNGKVGASYTVGIMVVGDRKYLNVMNNVCTDDQTPKTQTYGISETGLSAPDTNNRNNIAYNQFSGNLTAGILPAMAARTTVYTFVNNVNS